MANLKEVRERIKSVIGTQQITKAMKMVSAAKLRKAQNAIVQMRPYSVKLSQILSNIMANLEGDAGGAYGVQREIKTACVVVVTSSRGLCGAFNTNIIKSAVATIDSELSEVRKNGKLTIFCIGKKGFDFFRKRYPECTIISDYVLTYNDPSFDNVAIASQSVMDEFVAAKYDLVTISYGRFKNAAMQFAETEQFLPVKRLEATASKTKSDYIFEPSKEQLLKTLIPNILQTQFQKCVLDTIASEHGARMTAMDKATENAEGLLIDLRINYNKARQEAITKELSEIVGGAAAL
ncbi:MAG: ATP synthase F1 subunit gamma [Saprospiraceae bacterium]|jgi:F-type H+-transporting ATPase subunit gamma|nr:ATP synthase F1 subunit gamma [Saprospiraceae bacterium]